MTTGQEVQRFLARWASAMQRRDVDATSDLFLRDPAPLVTFSDGARAQDWLDVRVRINRDFERAILERVDVYDVDAREIAPDVVTAAFEYDMSVRDMWGTSNQVTRHGQMTLLRTKDGFRIAAAHFSAAK